MGDQMHQLIAKWTVSEKYNASQNVDYKKTNVDVCSFNTIEEFAYLMKNTIYSKVSDVLSEPQTCKIYKQFNDDSIDVQIEAIQFFKNDIKPWWEDESNKDGGKIQLDIPIQFYDIYDNLYQDILYEVIGQSNEDLQHVNGLRVVDKINAKQGNRIRIELWLDIDPNHNQHKSIQQLDNWLVSLIEKYQIEQSQLSLVSHKK